MTISPLPFECVFMHSLEWKEKENRNEENLDLHLGLNEHSSSFHHTAEFPTACKASQELHTVNI